MKHSTLVLLNIICLSNITIYSMDQNNNNKRRFTKNELLNRQRSLIRTQLLQTPKKQNSDDTNSLNDDSSSSQDSFDEKFTKKFPQVPHNTPIQAPKKLHHTPSGSSSSLSHELFK